MLPERKSTWSTVAGLTANAVAVSDTGRPTVTPAPPSGLVMVTDGTVILTFAAADVAVNPAESVTRAVRLAVPAAVGVHWIWYGVA